MDRVMGEISELSPDIPALTEDDLPVTAMHWTVGEHYTDDDDSFPLGDARQFDGDLLRIFVRAIDAPQGESAARYLASHEGELVIRLAYWTGESPSIVRMLLVPATMELLGDRNWWLPRWLDRLLPRIDVEGHGAEGPPPGGRREEVGMGV